MDLGSADAINAAIASVRGAGGGKVQPGGLHPAATGMGTDRTATAAQNQDRLSLSRRQPDAALLGGLPAKGKAVASAVGTRRVPDTLADGTERGPAAAERILLEDYALALVPSGQFLLDELTTPGPAPARAARCWPSAT